MNPSNYMPHVIIDDANLGAVDDVPISDVGTGDAILFFTQHL